MALETGQYWDHNSDAMEEEQLLTDKALYRKIHVHQTYLNFLLNSNLMSKVTNESKTYLVGNQEKLYAVEELSLSILSNPEEEEKSFDLRFVRGMRDCIKEVSKGWGGARGGLQGTDIFFHEVNSLVVNLARVFDMLRKEGRGEGKGTDLLVAVSAVRLLANVIKEVEDNKNLLRSDYQVRAVGFALVNPTAMSLHTMCILSLCHCLLSDLGTKVQRPLDLF